MRGPHFLTLALATLLVTAMAQPLAGGYKPIDDAANDADVQAAATFAVGAIDSGLKLVNVASASKQVVAGLNYRLTFVAAPANSTATSTYESVVYQPLGAAPLQLTSYKKVEG